MVKIITVTWSYEDIFDIKNTFLYKSFIKNNNKDNLIHIHYNRKNYLELEEEFSNRFSYQHEYILYKIFLTKEKIKSIDSDFLIFCDANDTVCLDNIDGINVDKKIMFSSEINQYPSSMGDFGGLEYSFEERLHKYFLNSGLFIANKEKYIELLESVVNNILPKNIKSFGGDQGIFVFHYLSKNNPDIILDIKNELFFCSFSRNYLDFLNFKFPIFVHDNGWNWGSPRFIEKFNLV